MSPLKEFSIGLLATSIKDSFSNLIDNLSEDSFLPNLKDCFIGITKTNIPKEHFDQLKKYILSQTKIDNLNIKMFWLTNITMTDVVEFVKNEAVNHKNKNLCINMGKIMQAN